MISFFLLLTCLLVKTEEGGKGQGGEEESKLALVLFKIFLLNQRLLIISLVGLKFEFYCMLQKKFHFFQKLTSTQKSTSFFSERNTKLR